MVLLVLLSLAVVLHCIVAGRAFDAIIPDRQAPVFALVATSSLVSVLAYVVVSGGLER